MRLKKSIYKNCLLAIMLTALTLPKIAMSQQIVGAFVMSSVGSIPNASNNSMPLTFTSSIACLNIQNGTTVLTGERGTGFFDVNCNTAIKLNTLGIQILPNPVNSISKLKLLNKPPQTENFTISIWSANGIRLINLKATGIELFQGKNIDFSGLTYGTYIIQVETANYLDALKFIKAQ
jgi:hypothetical protein